MRGPALSRKLLIISTLAVLAVTTAVIAGAYLERVPEQRPTLDDYRHDLTEAGFGVEVARADGSDTPPLGIEIIADQDPLPGSWRFRGTTVRLLTEPPEDTVVVPGLLGLFGPDAVEELAQTGLVVTWKERSGEHDAVVYSQEPTAGTVVAFGSTVSFEARFPHTPDAQTDARVKAVHGIMYARYGVDAQGPCSGCHTANTCYGSDCHTESAYLYLDKVTPDPH